MADDKKGNLLKRLVVGAFMGVIAISFAITGTGDVFSSMSNRTVAKVGSVEIPTASFQAEYERNMSRIANEQGKRLSATQARDQQVDQQVLRSMVVRQSIHNHADKLGVTTSDKHLIRQIKKIEAFNGVMGEFDQQTFTEVVSRAGYTNLSFEESIRKEVTTNQMTAAVLSGIQTPRAMAEAMIKDRLQRRSGSYIVLSPDLAGQIEAPSEEDLKEHYQDQILSYNVPESRDISLLLISPSNFTDDIVIPEEDVREIYDLTISAHTTPEERGVEHIFGSEEDIKAAKARIEAGESFLLVGLSMGLTDAEIQLGSVGRHGIADTSVANAAFAAQTTGLVGPIEGLSWSLVNVTSISPEVITPFDVVSGDIRQDLLLREAEREMMDHLETIEDGISSGTPLEETAERIGLNVTSVKGVTISGTTVAGARAAGMPDNDAEVLKETFASPKNFDSDLIELGTDSFFVVRVDEIYPSAPQSFEDVKSKVSGSWLAKARTEKLIDLAKDMVVRGNGGIAFENLAQEVGRGVLPTPGPLSRNQTTDIFSQNLIVQLFNTEPGLFFFAPVEIGESIVVFRHDEIVEADAALIGQYSEGYKQQLDQSIQADAQQLYLSALGSAYPVRQNPGAIAYATGQPTTTGQ